MKKKLPTIRPLVSDIPYPLKTEDRPKMRCFLGIEGGASHTTAVLIDEKGLILKRTEGGPCNLRLTRNTEIIRLWKQIRREIDPTLGTGKFLTGIGAFLAGCRTYSDGARIQRLLKTVWPHSLRVIGNDTSSAMAAALGEDDGVVLVCGTGSMIQARRGKKIVRIGGWGHVGGDRGSGYWMGRELLRSIFRSYDEKNNLDSLVHSVLALLDLNQLEELVQWSLDASKSEVASLAKALFRHSHHPTSRRIIRDAVNILVLDVALAIRKAGFSSASVKIAINPGLAHHQPLFRRHLVRAIRQKIPHANIFLFQREGAMGAAMLAAKATGIPSSEFRVQRTIEHVLVQKRNLSQALTEQRNPRTMNLDHLSVPRLVQTMLDEESRTIPAIAKQAKSIARVVQWIVHSLKQGGHLFYVGAGTSGRLGVLDAAECPPTFGCDPEMIQGVIAGGRQALDQSVESAEDNANDGRQAIQNRGVQKRDIVIGITASGSTPFVLGALEEAHACWARTVLLTFNPNSTFRIPHSTFTKITISTGPEVIAGSTRLKAGTATKLILNIFSTIAMVRLGKVRSNLMVDLDPTCEKLHDRAARIYALVKEVSYNDAWGRLEKGGWDLKRLLQT